MKAIALVESSGSGFQADGRPKILFEGVIFWWQLVHKGINPEQFVKGNEDILYSKWTNQFYSEDQYTRLNKAVLINSDSAYASASYGLFQIMGENFKEAGYSDVIEFVEAMKQSEVYQLQAVLSYLSSRNMIQYLVSKNWDKFALMYNGPLYQKNNYAQKLQVAYNESIYLNSL